MKNETQQTQLKLSKNDYEVFAKLKKYVSIKHAYYFFSNPDLNRECKNNIIFLFNQESGKHKEISKIGNKSLLGLTILSEFKARDNFSHTGIFDNKTGKFEIYPISLNELTEWKKTTQKKVGIINQIDPNLNFQIQENFIFLNGKRIALHY